MAINGKQLVLFFESEEWKKISSGLSMFNNAAIAGQNLKIYNEDLNGNEIVGYVQTVHTGADFFSIAGMGNKNVMDIVGTVADVVAVVVTFYNINTENKELSTADNSITMGDLLTIGGIIASRLPEGAVKAFGGGVLSIAGITYTLFQSVDGHNQWTMDYLMFGYERTIMKGFINELWEAGDKLDYRYTTRESGGAQTVK